MAKLQLRLAALMVSGVLLLGACNGFKLFHSTDDKTITSNIQAKLFSDPILKTRDVRVDARNGMVTLSGTVGTDLERAAVERIATQEDGVKSVENMLNVAMQSTAPVRENPQTADRLPPPQQVAPAPPSEPPAPEKPRHKHSAKPQNDEGKSSAELHSNSNPIASESAENPAPPPEPAPAPAPTPVAPPQVATAPMPPPPPPPPAPKPQEHLTIPEGTVLTIRMVDGIDSSRNRSGEEFAATLDAPIVVDDRVVAPRGVDAHVRLVDAKTAGRVSGQSELQLELVSVVINGVAYTTHSGYYAQHGGSRGKRTAETVGGGAILGALIGGIFGGGKGAAIGSAAGAGAGTAVQVSTKGEQVKVPAETKLDFTLTDPVTVTVSGNE